MQQGLAALCMQQLLHPQKSFYPCPRGLSAAPWQWGQKGCWSACGWLRSMHRDCHDDDLEMHERIADVWRGNGSVQCFIFQCAVTGGPLMCQRRRGLAGPGPTFPVDAAGSLLLAQRWRKKEACTPATSFRRRTFRRRSWQSSKEAMQWLAPPLALTSCHLESLR